MGPSSRAAPSRPVAIALGSNQGDREAHLAFATLRLRGLVRDLVVSSFIETAPEERRDQPWFLNGVALGWSDAEPERLLEALLEIECDRGRERPFAGAPRTLDLDLILVGELVRRGSSLELPHPRFRDRRFVLGPLVSIGPNLVDPVTRLTMRELLTMLEG